MKTYEKVDINIHPLVISTFATNRYQNNHVWKPKPK